MSGRFDFHSSGAAATGALEQLLAEREHAQRQAMIDEITRSNSESQQQDRVMNRTIQQAQLDAMTEQRGQVAEDRKTGLAFKIADTVPAGANMTPELESALGPMAGAMTHSEGGVLPQGEGPTETKTFTGTQHGQEFLENIDARKEAAANAEAARVEAERIRAEDRKTAATDAGELRSEIAKGNNQTALTIAGMGRDAKVATAESKATEGKQKTDLARKAQIDAANDTLKAISEMKDPTNSSKLSPEMLSIVGSWSSKWPEILTNPKGDIANARARLAEVQSRQITGLLNELKAQSQTGATGFGSLSESELKVIEAASSRLKVAQSPEQFMEALNTVEEKVKRILREPGASKPGDTVYMPPPGQAKPTAQELINKYRR